ncbi:MAG: D-alanyl-D-alanine carboxypeptidase [Methylobacterium mesophilicum]|nr:D-alanyl-D-alanine carboxypeptidase [Methylobacterium mesophilicum]
MRLRHLTPLLLAFSVFASGTAQANPALLFDIRTGEVLEHQEAFRRWHPASLTKLMTAYTTFRAIDAGELTLQSPIRVSRHAASMPPAKMGYKPGSVMTLDNAIKMIMVKSANDIAMAIGENVGGSESAFAARMNAEAKRLGMTGSHWVNPNGLHDPDQYTTARDLAILVRAIRTEYPRYATYFNIDGIVVGKKVLKTFNTLMGRFPGADGMKTGFVCASGFNLIGSATRDGRTLGAIVLGAPSPDERAEEAARMLIKGFDNRPANLPQLTALAPYGEKQFETTDMRDVVCNPKTAQKASDGPQQTDQPEVAVTQAPSPSVLSALGPAQHLETVGLGGALGPVPKAMQDMNGDAVADVPIPSWRPDLPVPGLKEPLAQGDNDADEKPVPSPTGRGDRLVRQPS